MVRDQISMGPLKSIACGFTDARFVEMVAHWKTHPAILMWMFGNEVNATTGINRAAWYSLVTAKVRESSLEFTPKFDWLMG